MTELDARRGVFPVPPGSEAHAINIIIITLFALLFRVYNLDTLNILTATYSHTLSLMFTVSLVNIINIAREIIY